MDSIIWPILLGILSSLIATFIFLWLHWFFRTFIIPWYIDKIYKGVRIDGRWILKVKDEAEKKKLSVRFDLQQRADQLEGIFSLTQGDSVELFKLKGIIRDAIVTLTWLPTVKDTIDSGAAVLRVFVREKGLNMKGTFSTISTESGEIISSYVEFEKQNA